MARSLHFAFALGIFMLVRLVIAKASFLRLARVHLMCSPSRVRYIDVSTQGLGGRVVEASGTLVFREVYESGLLWER
jgi:hypothetical protein